MKLDVFLKLFADKVENSKNQEAFAELLNWHNEHVNRRVLDNPERHEFMKQLAKSERHESLMQMVLAKMTPAMGLEMNMMAAEMLASSKYGLIIATTREEIEKHTKEVAGRYEQAARMMEISAKQCKDPIEQAQCVFKYHIPVLQVLYRIRTGHYSQSESNPQLAKALFELVKQSNDKCLKNAPKLIHHPHIALLLMERSTYEATIRHTENSSEEDEAKIVFAMHKIKKLFNKYQIVQNEMGQSIDTRNDSFNECVIYESLARGNLKVDEFNACLIHAAKCLGISKAKNMRSRQARSHLYMALATHELGKKHYDEAVNSLSSALRVDDGKSFVTKEAQELGGQMLILFNSLSEKVREALLAPESSKTLLKQYEQVQFDSQPQSAALALDSAMKKSKMKM